MRRSRLLRSLVFLFFGALTGCVEAPVAPNLRLPELKCPKVEAPPVPQVANLHIQGDHIEADAGGALLLRWYVFLREQVR